MPPRFDLKHDPKAVRAAHTTPSGSAPLHQSLTSLMVQRALGNSQALTADVLNVMRQSYGKAFVQRLLERSTAHHKPTAPTTQSQDDFLNEIQQARAANANHSGNSALIQAMSIQRQVGDVMGGLDVPPNLESQIEAARGSGSPLAEGSRAKLEGAFGADLSDVRVHTDTASDTLNRAVQARAFATGHDIFFRQGAYNPGSAGGQELLAHELTHVVQQTPQRLSRTPGSSTQSSVEQRESGIKEAINVAGEAHTLFFAPDGTLSIASTPTPLQFYIDELLGTAPDGSLRRRILYLRAKATHIHQSKQKIVALASNQFTRQDDISDTRSPSAAQYTSTQFDAINSWDDVANNLQTLGKDLNSIVTEMGLHGENRPQSQVDLEALTSQGGLNLAKGVTAKPLSIIPGNTAGSPPSVDSNASDPTSRLYAALQGPYHRGHLLNHHLHGPGDDWRNLAVVTSNVNGMMEVLYESFLKKKVLGENQVVYYKMDVKYAGQPGFDPKDLKYYLPTEFVIDIRPMTVKTGTGAKKTEWEVKSNSFENFPMSIKQNDIVKSFDEEIPAKQETKLSSKLPTKKTSNTKTPQQGQGNISSFWVPQARPILDNPIASEFSASDWQTYAHGRNHWELSAAEFQKFRQRQAPQSDELLWQEYQTILQKEWEQEHQEYQEQQQALREYEEKRLLEERFSVLHKTPHPQNFTFNFSPNRSQSNYGVYPPKPAPFSRSTESPFSGFVPSFPQERKTSQISLSDYDVEEDEYASRPTSSSRNTKSDLWNSRQQSFDEEEKKPYTPDYNLTQFALPEQKPTGFLGSGQLEQSHDETFTYVSDEDAIETSAPDYNLEQFEVPERKSESAQGADFEWETTPASEQPTDFSLQSPSVFSPPTEGKSLKTKFGQPGINVTDAPQGKTPKQPAEKRRKVVTSDNASIAQPTSGDRQRECAELIASWATDLNKFKLRGNTLTFEEYSSHRNKIVKFVEGYIKSLKKYDDILGGQRISTFSRKTATVLSGKPKRAKTAKNMTVITDINDLIDAYKAVTP
jgi:hypothetical protein